MKGGGMGKMKYPMAYIGQVLRMMKALLAAYVMTGLFLLITAGLMYRFELSEGKVKIAVIGIYVLSCFTGGFLGVSFFIASVRERFCTQFSSLFFLSLI